MTTNIEANDPELETWKREWQELGGEEELARELAARVASDRRRVWRSAIRELLGAAFSTALSFWLIARSHGELVTIAVCGTVLIFNGVWTTRLFVLRESFLRSSSFEGKGLDSFVDLTRHKLIDDLKWNAFARIALIVLLLVLVPMSVWAFVARYEMYRAEPWRAYVGFGVAFGIFGACFFVGQRKRRRLIRESERFELLVAERSLV